MQTSSDYGLMDREFKGEFSGLWPRLHRDGPDEITVTVRFVGTLCAAAGCDACVHRFSSGITLEDVFWSVGRSHLGLARVLETPESYVATVQGREAHLQEPLMKDTTVTLMPSAVCLKGISGAHTGRPCVIHFDSGAEPVWH